MLGLNGAEVPIGGQPVLHRQRCSVMRLAFSSLLRKHLCRFKLVGQALTPGQRHAAGCAAMRRSQNFTTSSRSPAQDEIPHLQPNDPHAKTNFFLQSTLLELHLSPSESPAGCVAQKSSALWLHDVGRCTDMHCSISKAFT